MVTYKSFDELLTATTVDRSARLRFTRDWLRSNYSFVPKDEKFIDLLSDVHDHDDLPKHFGQVRVASAFLAFTVQLSKMAEGWHIAVSKDSDNGQFTVLHPIHESGSKEPTNKSLRLQLAQLSKTGKVTEPEPVVSSPAPQGLALPEEEPAVEEETLPPAAVDPAEFIVNENGKTTSISIDMSQFK